VVMTNPSHCVLLLSFRDSIQRSLQPIRKRAFECERSVRVLGRRQDPNCFTCAQVSCTCSVVALLMDEVYIALLAQSWACVCTEGWAWISAFYEVGGGLTAERQPA
jgi:hypothetical protein